MSQMSTEQMRDFIETVMKQRREIHRAELREFLEAEMKRDGFWDDHFKAPSFRARFRSAVTAALIVVLGVVSLVGVFALFVPFTNMSSTMATARQMAEDAKASAEKTETLVAQTAKDADEVKTRLEAAKKAVNESAAVVKSAKQAADDAKQAADEAIQEFKRFQETLAKEADRNEFVQVFTEFAKLPEASRHDFGFGIEIRNSVRKHSELLDRLTSDYGGLLATTNFFNFHSRRTIAATRGVYADKVVITWHPTPVMDGGGYWTPDPAYEVHRWEKSGDGSRAESTQTRFSNEQIQAQQRALEPDGAQLYVFEDRTVTPGKSYLYRIRRLPSGNNSNDRWQTQGSWDHAEGWARAKN